MDTDDTEQSWVEELVPQVEDEYHDTTPMEAQPGPGRRASTSSDWPPSPPLPADVDFAVGTFTSPSRDADDLELAAGTLSNRDEEDDEDLDLAAGSVTEGQPVRRHAGIFAAVRRPTTSGD